MYGSTSCGYCTRQKELFGSSFQYVKYVDCEIDTMECLTRNLNAFPTWIKFQLIESITKGESEGFNFEGSTEVGRGHGLHTIRELSNFSGCKLEEA